MRYILAFYYVIMTILILIDLAASRPLIRHIYSSQEFDMLLRKHASKTGLPVVVDFYSDSCGPCRIMAPVFHRIAKEFSQSYSAIFAKVNVNSHSVYELSSRYHVKSMPTFIFFWNAKKFSAFSGADERKLRQYIMEIVKYSEHENFMLTRETLRVYYENMKDTKSIDFIERVYNKCADMNSLYNDDRLCVGSVATKFVDRLREKYGKSPDLFPRFTEKDRFPVDKKDEKVSDEKSNKDKNHVNISKLHHVTEKNISGEIDSERKREYKINENNNEFSTYTESQQCDCTKGDFPEQVTIVGGGPAGLTAAIYAARSGLSPLVIAPTLGGQLQGKGVDVENYPGLAISMTGSSMIATMRSQAAHFGACFASDTVVSIDASVRPFRLYTNSSFTENKPNIVIDTHTVIVATGAESRWLHIPGEYEYRGSGVSSCATCDGALYRGKDIIVVGGGDAAMEEALVLARTSKYVTLVHRRSEFRASKILVERVKNHPSIQIIWNSVLKEIFGNVRMGEKIMTSDSSKHVTGVRLQNIETLQISLIKCSAVFVAIGHIPSTSFLKGVVRFDEPDRPGYILTMGRSTVTSISGIFAAGDVSDSVYRQAVTSAGSGAAAALDAERWLIEEGLGNEAEELQTELLNHFVIKKYNNSELSIEGTIC